MFDIQFMENDSFLELSKEARLLYIELCLSADDDGLTKSKRKALTISEATEEAFNELLSNSFIYYIENVVVIRHWKLHNQIQKDRYHKTIYQNVMSKLILDCDKTYVYKTDTNCIQNVYLDKTSIDKTSIDKLRKEESTREGSDLSQTIKNIDSNHILNESDIQILCNHINEHQISDYVRIVLSYINKKEGK